MSSLQVDDIDLYLGELEGIVGPPLPSRLIRFPWTFWSNGASERAHRWLSAGFRTHLADVPDGVVRFVRADELSQDVDESPTDRGRADLALVGVDGPPWSSASLGHELLRVRHLYAARSAARTLILSRDHGRLVGDLDVYRQKTSDAANQIDDDREWARQIVESLERDYGPMQGRVIELHTSFAGLLHRRVEALGATVRSPADTSGDDGLVRWYAERLAFAPATADDPGDGNRSEAVADSNSPGRRHSLAGTDVKCEMGTRLPAPVDLSSDVWTRAGGTVGVEPTTPVEPSVPAARRMDLEPSPTPATRTEDERRTDLPDSSHLGDEPHGGRTASQIRPRSRRDRVSRRRRKVDEAPYTAWAPDQSLPVLSSPGGQREAVLRIVEREGPVTGRRINRVIAEAVGDESISSTFASMLNRATWACERDGTLLSDNPLGVSGQQAKTFRLAGQPRMAPRSRGPRQLTDIPPDELAARLSEFGDLRGDERAWFDAVLDSYDIADPPRGAMSWLRKCVPLVDGATRRPTARDQAEPAVSSDESSDARPATRQSRDRAGRQTQRLTRLRSATPSEGAEDEDIAASPPVAESPYPTEFVTHRRSDLERARQRTADQIRGYSGRARTRFEDNRLHGLRRQMRDITDALE